MKWSTPVGLDDASRGELALFVLVAAFSVALAIAGIRYPEQVGGVFSSSFDFVLVYFGWWFILLSFLLTVGLTVFCLSRYGHVRIGGPDADPEFGRLSWLAMVFTVGYSISVLFWGVAEPLWIVSNPPSPAPIRGPPIESLALAFVFLHDILPGLIAWYLPFGLAFGLVVWRTESWKVSSVLRPLLDPDRFRAVYWLVDFVSLVAIVGGLATSLGFIGRQLGSIVSVVYGVDSRLVTLGLFALVAALFVVDVWLGLRRGIRNAARIAVLANVLLTVVLFVLGPSLFIIELGLDAMGVWLGNLPQLMLYTAPMSDGHWPQNWTSFWWAWWAAWGVFVGSFVARVSKGRTVREVFLGLCVAPTSLLLFQHSVLGGIALAPPYRETILQALQQRGNAAALSAALEALPYSDAVAALAVLALVGYILTSLDSAVYMLSAINLGNREPNVRNRAAWGLLMVAIGVMTTYVGGGTSVLESFSTTLALPFTGLYLVVGYVLFQHDPDG
ncbi:Choline-glycine betaine transporter [Haloplanus vescus]|uniref:Choline-glycine betaine transporter n=1 Tax=Haloplanus vescus TaxID=555874 RepID=A0A1H3VRH6_9EURY|nr:BCCT family transporter [Haloplanus vescus]SDZ77281.1 Choline-glycine betaine transporter [Haloplanus vescus]